MKINEDSLVIEVPLSRVPVGDVFGVQNDYGGNTIFSYYMKVKAAQKEHELHNVVDLESGYLYHMVEDTGVIWPINCELNAKV